MQANMEGAMIKKVKIYLLIIIMLTSSLGCCANSVNRNSRVAGTDFSYQISIDMYGKINVIGNPKENYDFSEWENIVSIATGIDKAAALKSDGTVVITGENVEAFYTEEWRDIIIIGFTYSYLFGLKKDGTIVYTGSTENMYDSENIEDDVFLNAENEIIEEIKSWKDIIFIDTTPISVVGVKRDGKVIAAAPTSRALEEYVASWSNVKYISVSTTQIIGVTYDDDILVAFNELSSIFCYREPYNDFVGAKKICAGDYYVAGLMPDGKVKVRTIMLFKMPIEYFDTLTDEEKIKMHEKNQENLNKSYETINNVKDVIDIYSFEEYLIILQRDGTVLCVAEQAGEDGY